MAERNRRSLDREPGVPPQPEPTEPLPGPGIPPQPEPRPPPGEPPSPRPGDPIPREIDPRHLSPAPAGPSPGIGPPLEVELPPGPTGASADNASPAGADGPGWPIRGGEYRPRRAGIGEAAVPAGGLGRCRTS
jgi:hypothetical protein